jgi:hypothetical protein
MDVTRHVQSLQPAGFKKTRELKSNTLTPLTYTQVADHYRDMFEVGDTWTNFTRACEGPAALRSNEDSLNSPTQSRVDEFLSRRTPSTNAIAFYNANQKVFKALFDEGRSCIRMADFANSTYRVPLFAGRLKYESFLSKTSEKFFTAKYAQSELFSSPSDASHLLSSVNTKLSDIPFLLSIRSDASRYL